jgi:hypothetical protein
MVYRYGRSTYEIVVSNPSAMQDGDVEVVVDGHPVDGGRLRLVDDGKRHAVRVRPRQLAMKTS